MSRLLIATAVCADDAPLLEKCLDWTYFLNGKQPKGHILLAYAADLHAEMRVRLKISAELAFEGVSEISLNRQGNPQNKVEQINSAFRQVAAHVQSHYRWPWLFLEPDAVPLKSNWLEVLADAYDSQAKRFCGPLLGSAQKILGMSRVGIYNSAAGSELAGFCNDPNVGYEFVAGEYVVPRCTKTKLIQSFQVTDDASMQRIRPDAVLLHGDKWGKVIAKLRQEAKKVPTVQEMEATMVRQAVVAFLPESPLPIIHVRNGVGEMDLTEPKDKRTKAYRDWKAKIDAAKKAPLQTA